MHVDEIEPRWSSPYNVGSYAVLEEARSLHQSDVDGDRSDMPVDIRARDRGSMMDFAQQELALHIDLGQGRTPRDYPPRRSWRRLGPRVNGDMAILLAKDALRSVPRASLGRR